MPRKKLGSELLLGPGSLKESFKELSRVGLVYTRAQTPDEIGKKRYPIRAVGRAPAQDLAPNEITVGPFPLEKEHYLTIRADFEAMSERQSQPDEEKVSMLCAYLAFRKLQYEKTGTSNEDYSIQTSVESSRGLATVFSLLSYFEVENPFMGEAYVWIYPKDECRLEISKTRERRFRKDDFSWWNTVIRLDDLKLETCYDYPERYCIFPMELVKWYRYLPGYVAPVIPRLYAMASVGGKLKAYESLSEVLKEINDELECLAEAERKHGHSDPDREVLIKELYDFNRINYPLHAEEVFDFLSHIGFIGVDSSQGKARYLMAEQCPDPKEILRFPSGWHERAETYVRTGSVLFSYLTVEEAVK